ncbi:NAD(P)/FAD-dependent oxidoreductase [Marinactinospora rubrisoli]|uniref:NAD(P)/FAD-dependent oxidoreductase n=2 Tax=Marinactinospora rubrisoli TaxID=2715399 RepID=A0ABW2KFZ2_9ACTN
MQCLVIGAGVMGAATAAALARRGVGVTLVEAEPRAASGTSGTSFAWVNANRKPRPDYHDLNAAGVAAHHELARRARDHGRDAAWFHPFGHLEWAVDPRHRAELRTRVGRLMERGYPVRWLTPAEARSREPRLRVPADADVALFPEEAHCDPAALADALLAEAAALGADVRFGARAVGLTERTDGAEAVLASGERLHADRVVCCAGNGTPALLAGLGATVPMVAPARGNAAMGLLAVTAATDSGVRGVVTTDEVNLRPWPGGRLLVQALELDAAADPDAAPDPALGAAFHDRLAAVLAGGPAPGIETVVTGRRVLPADGFTVAGPLDGHPAVYVLVSHSGVTLAPLLGALAAEELDTGRPAALLAGFRPGRFAAGTPFPPVTAARRPGEQ